MENAEAIVKQRRVVYDVRSPDQHVPRNNRKRKKKNRNKNRSFSPGIVESETLHFDEFPVPMELRPVIVAALEYGKKTHAIGALRAAQLLGSIAVRLKDIGPSLSNGHNDIVQKLIIDAEAESMRIMSSFSAAYNDDVDDNT